MKDRIENLIELVANACIPWIKQKDGAIQFIDPLDHEEISAHYGATHAAVALIIYGNEKRNERILKQGEELLYSVIERWEKSKELPGFHNDFNNFALCVLDSYTKEYHERIQKTVLETADSNHDTVNWLPMRWYVNKCRYDWTGDQKYLVNSRACEEKIKKAIYNDGFIDDRLPVGMSFNLQYDVATVAVMQFLRISGEEIELGKELGALLNAVCPDGDINYLGRGTNQIFAWGLWTYLLASAGQDELDRALKYLEDRLPTMLKNHNIMLNDYPGEEKYMWWDYHYCSVYTAHLLLWLVLSWKDIEKAKIEPKVIDDGSSGVHIYKNENAFVATFDGRTEYLAERGHIIAAIWTKKYGTICKGTFGPWCGAFGNKYMQPDVTLRNFTGLLKDETERDWSQNRFVRKIFPRLRSKAEITFRPLFPCTSIDINNGVHISFDSNKNGYILNMVSMCEGVDAKVSFNNERIQLIQIMKIKSQYGWGSVLQSKAIFGLYPELIIQ